MSRFIIACGGTGGHLAPGIAVAESLQSKGHQCQLLISHKQVDSALVAKYEHLNFIKTPGRAFAGGIVARLRFIVSLTSAFFAARRLLRAESPDLVLLFGGFLSLGLGLAAKSMGVPVALHEANTTPGKAIRLMKPLATRIYLPDGVQLEGVPAERIHYLGYPVRREIQPSEKVDACQRLGLVTPDKLLVVIGGSQGASALNDWVDEHFERLAEAGVAVYCVTGLSGQSARERCYTRADGSTMTAHFIPFSDQMGDVLSAADLVLSRAGAGAIAEIIRCHVPSILVPYPYAADDHQNTNARAHEQAGAGVLLPQSRLGSLADQVLEMIFDDEALAAYRSKLEQLDQFDSSEQIAADLLSMCSNGDVREVESAL